MSLYAPTFELASFDEASTAEREALLAMLVETLAFASRIWLRRHPTAPLLYESGTVFEREPDDRDNWQDAPRTLSLRSGDCEDLVAWRLAELRERFGEETARPQVDEFKEVRPSGALMTEYHVRIRRADGSLEDPSAILGMP